MAPAFFNISAERGRLAPRGMTTSTGERAGPAPFQPWMNQKPRIRSSAAPSASSFFTAGSDRLHHQAGIGAAEAEAVVQHRLHLALLGDERDEVDPRRALARIFEVERRRHDLVAKREDAEDRLDRAGAAEQMADRRFGRAHREMADIVAEQAPDRPKLELVAKRRRSAMGVDIVDVGKVE